MESHFDLTDAEFESQFRASKITPSVFSHEAHIRLAWIHITKYGSREAEVNIKKQLAVFVDLVGAKDKYNETLTIAAIKIVNSFVMKSTSNNFPDFIQEFAQLKTNFKGLVAKHYGFDIYQNEKAKAEFLTPDLLPFD